MFTCQACLRRYFHGLLVDQSTRTALPLHGSRTSGSIRPGSWPAQALSSRSFASEAVPQRTADYDDDPTPVTWAKSREAQSQKFKINDTRYPKPGKQQRGTDAEKEQLEASLKIELKYLQDPVALARRVDRLLSEKNESKAHALCRVSSRAVANVVSWNHLINYQMQKGSTVTALHTYNEMKKRGIRPDSHTYLLVLRGLAEYAHHPNSLSRALSVYHSMTNPNTTVRPSIMHTNAVLKVCARANDTESLMDIVSRMPERGPDSPDSWTFTTVLNHLRYGAQEPLPDPETEQQKKGRPIAAVIQGRKLWGIIVDRWRKGELMMDEGLTCAMGRLLLISPRPRDWDDILSLVHQTMNLARPMPRLNMPGREAPPVPKSHVLGQSSAEGQSNEALSRDLEQDEVQRDSVWLNPSIGSSYDVVNVNDPKQHNSMAAPAIRKKDGKTTFRRMAFAKPGQNTLSLVLESCLKQIAKQPALDYYNYLTSQQAEPLVPDQQNLNMLIRILRQAHASAAALAIVKEEFPKHSLKPMPKTFRLAMSTCLRDNRSPNTLDIAGKILDLSLGTLWEPDIRVLNIYLSIAQVIARNTAFPNLPPPKMDPHDLDGYTYSEKIDRVELLVPPDPSNPEERAKHTAARVTEARILIRALERIEPAMLDLKTLVTIGRPRSSSTDDRPYTNKRLETDGKDKETIVFLRRIVNVYYKLLHRNLDPRLNFETDVLTPYWRRTFMERQKALSAWLRSASARLRRRQERSPVHKSMLTQPPTEPDFDIGSDDEEVREGSLDMDGDRPLQAEVHG